MRHTGVPNKHARARAVREHEYINYMYMSLALNVTLPRACTCTLHKKQPGLMTSHRHVMYSE